jgi:hypothetical protein
MKRIVWIAVVTLMVSGIAGGEVTKPSGEEAPAAPASGDSGSMAAEGVGQPAAEKPAAFGGGYSGGAVGERPSRATTSAPAGFGSRATESAPDRPAAVGPSVSRSSARPDAASTTGFEIEMRRAPGYGARTTTVGKAVTFKLLDVRTQAVYGPFELRDEARVTLDDKQYVLLMAEKTEAKAKLEERLRRTVLESLELKEAKFQDVVKTLAYAPCEDDPNGAPLNIVVAPAQLLEQLPTITINLRNIPLYDAIRYVTEVAAATFRVDDHAVVITVR